MVKILILKNFLKKFHVLLWGITIRICNVLFKVELVDEKAIPIIINNRNRLTFMIKLIEALELRGYTNIYILDNNSTYPPLLDYYLHCSYTVYRLKKNYGHLALWKSGLAKKFINNYYVYTDSDVVPSIECPFDFIGIIREKLIVNKDIMKIGLGLRINDLPDHFENKNLVQKWERQFHVNDPADTNYHIANVDTTFAVYRPFATQGQSGLKMLRTKHPCDAIHMPWYNNSKTLSEEEKYYLKTSETSTHWTQIEK